MTSELITFNHLGYHSSSKALGTKTGYWKPTGRGTDKTPPQSGISCWIFLMFLKIQIDTIWFFFAEFQCWVCWNIMPAWHAPNLAINCIENTREKNASEDPYQYGSFFSLLHSGRFEVISFPLLLMYSQKYEDRQLPSNCENNQL